MWESSKPYGRVEPFSEIRREAEYATTLIPVLRHDRNQTRLRPGGGAVSPSRGDDF
jgi:hypothetical protein